MSGHANGHAAEEAAVVVFGIDEKGRHHASRFSPGEATAARQAAAAMGLHALGIESCDHRAITAQLPVGRIFGSGKAFVPYVKAELYGALAAMAGVRVSRQPELAQRHSATSAAPAIDGSVGEGSSAEVPADVKSDESGDHKGRIKVGGLVLATTGQMEGWYEARVVEMKGDVLKLQWRDWPDEPGISRRLKEIAFLPPAYREPAA